MADDPYEAIQNSTVQVIMTPWSEYLNLDWQRVKHLAAHAHIFDVACALDPQYMRKQGIEYDGTGRWLLDEHNFFLMEGDK